jgi:hypothetical protein
MSETHFLFEINCPMAGMKIHKHEGRNNALSEAKLVDIPAAEKVHN